MGSFTHWFLVYFVSFLKRQNTIALFSLWHCRTNLNKSLAIVSLLRFCSQAVKKEKYMEDFSKMVPVVHPFGIYAATKNVCAFVNGEEEAEK